MLEVTSIKKTMKLKVTVLITGLITAQVSFGADYFPLQVGNVWYLTSIPRYVEAKVVIDSMEYYKVCFPWSCSYYRKDDMGNIYVRSDDGEESLKYKLSGNVGDVWRFKEGDLDYMVRLESKTDTVTTQSGTFYNCYRITFIGINVIDADYSLWLAPDVGIVKTESLNWGIETFLIKAKVDGRRIPSHPVPPEVTETIPYDGQVDVPSDAHITLKFNFSIKPDFINSTYIKITSEKDGFIPGSFTNDYKYSFHMVKFTPDAPFAYDDTIYVTISSELEDYTGDQLSGDYRFSFVTEPEVEEAKVFLRDTTSSFTRLGRGDFDVGDYDNDGDEDIVVFGAMDSVGVGRSYHVEIYENFGSGFRRIPTEFEPLDPGLGYGRGCIKWVDYNNDGLLDVVYSGHDTSYQSITLFYKNLGGKFEVDPTVRLNFGYASMDWDDYDRDGFMDLAIWGYSNRRHTSYAAVYRNDNCNLTKQNIPDLPYGSPGRIRWMDFDNDGDADVVTIGQELDRINFYENTDDGFCRKDLRISDRSWLPHSYSIDFADIDNDGDVDLLIGSYLLLRKGNTFILDKGQVDHFSRAFVKFDDFDHDNYMDLFVVGNKEDNISRKRTYIQVYRNIGGKLSLYKEINLRKYVHIFSAKWRDLNNDGMVDLAMMTDEGFLIYYNLMDHPAVGVSVDDGKEAASDRNREAALFNAYPNPFNSSTNIEYFVPIEGKVLLDIYSIRGQLIKTLVNGVSPRGRYSVQWDGTDDRGIKVSSGVYLYRIRAGSFTKTKKVVLLR